MHVADLKVSHTLLTPLTSSLCVVCGIVVYGYSLQYPEGSGLAVAF